MVRAIVHVEGIAWYLAPIPPEEHRCAAQTIGLLDRGEIVERCACGGIRYVPGPWMDRNSRKCPEPRKRRWFLWR